MTNSHDDSEDFAALFARHESASQALQVGQVVKGRVFHITGESVFVDVGGKGEAWIDRAELVDDEGRLRVGVGDEIEATVVKTGDRPGSRTSSSAARRHGRRSRWRTRAGCPSTARSRP